MTRTFMLQELINNLVLLCVCVCVCYVLCVKMGVDNGCAHQLSTGVSREAPVDNECFSLSLGSTRRYHPHTQNRDNSKAFGSTPVEF